MPGYPVDGSVVTWSAADFDGDSSMVQDQLRVLQRTQASCSASAAILRASVLCQSEFFGAAVHFASWHVTAALFLELLLSRCIGALQPYVQGASPDCVLAGLGASTLPFVSSSLQGPASVLPCILASWHFASRHCSLQGPGSVCVL